MSNDSLLEQKNFSALELFQGERWLLESGVITESTADTLMSYGYMIPDILKVDLKIDMDIENNCSNPTCSYDLQLTKFKGFLYRKAQKAREQGGLIGKLKLLIYIKFGAPSPNQMENGVHRMAVEFLPKNFKVYINVR